MENLKLRAWDSFNEEMVYSSEEDAQFTLENGKWSVKYIREKNMSNGGIEIDAPVWQDSDEVEIMHSVGIKDTNDKDVYAGDIMASLYITGPAIVEYNEEISCYVLRYSEKSFVRIDVRKHILQIIGNVHQNPDLITF